MISKRLKDIASLVDNNSIIIDIGSDHAYLPIYLIETKKIKKAYAVDNKIGPLNNAISNIKNNNMIDSIIPILSDGFKSVNVTDYNTIIIAGMGADSIINIIDYKIIDDDITLILEANNNSYKLRRYLMENNYLIIDEILSNDKDFYYSIIKAKKTTESIKYSEEELFFGPIILKNRPVELNQYKNKLLMVLNNAMKNAEDNQEILKKIKFIKEA